MSYDGKFESIEDRLRADGSPICLEAAKALIQIGNEVINLILNREDLLAEIAGLRTGDLTSPASPRTGEEPGSSTLATISDTRPDASQFDVRASSSVSGRSQPVKFSQ